MKTKSVLGISTLIALQLLLAGCIATWARVEPDTRIVKNDMFSVTAPVGWMRIDGPPTTSLVVNRDGSRTSVPAARVVLTRDGLNLNRIEVTHLGSVNAFPHIKKEHKDSMLPSEVADLYIADLKAAGGMENLTVVRNSPRTISGNAGFELLIAYHTSRGLRAQRLTYGFANKAGLFLIWYEAPAIHYYEMYKEVFDRVAGTFQLVTAKA